MAKKRGVKKPGGSRLKKAEAGKKQVKKANAYLQKKDGEKPAEKESTSPLFSDIFNHASDDQKTNDISNKEKELRGHEEEELRGLGKEARALENERGIKQPATKSGIPVWFYIASIFAAFMFTLYISIFATIHFESIEYMNITIVFLFISLVSYFLISAVYFISEKRISHSPPAFLFFAGISAIMVYAFKAVDTSNLVRFSIVYTIIVAAVSSYVLAVRRK